MLFCFVVCGELKPSRWFSQLLSLCCCFSVSGSFQFGLRNPLAVGLWKIPRDSRLRIALAIASLCLPVMIRLLGQSRAWSRPSLRHWKDWRTLSNSTGRIIHSIIALGLVEQYLSRFAKRALHSLLWVASSQKMFSGLSSNALDNATKRLDNRNFLILSSFFLESSKKLS